MIISRSIHVAISGTTSFFLGRSSIPSYVSVHACVLSCFIHVWLFATLWTVAHQASLSTGFSRQEYWSRLPFPSPGDVLDPVIETVFHISCTGIGKVMLIVCTLDTIRWKWHFIYPGYLPNLIMRKKKNKTPNSHRKASYKIPQKYSKLSRSSKRSLRNCYSQGETKYNVVCTTRSWKSASWSSSHVKKKGNGHLLVSSLFTFRKCFHHLLSEVRKHLSNPALIINPYCWKFALGIWNHMYIEFNQV